MEEERQDENQTDGAFSIGRGYALGITVLSISAQMVVFPLLGLWVDSKLGTGVLFGAIGFVAGLYATLSQLIRLVNRPEDKK